MNVYLSPLFPRNAVSLFLGGAGKKCKIGQGGELVFTGNKGERRRRKRRENGEIEESRAEWKREPYHQHLPPPQKKEEDGGGVGWERGKGVKMEVGKADVEGRDLNVN